MAKPGESAVPPAATVRQHGERPFALPGGLSQVKEIERNVGDCDGNPLLGLAAIQKPYLDKDLQIAKINTPTVVQVHSGTPVGR